MAATGETGEEQRTANFQPIDFNVPAEIVVGMAYPNNYYWDKFDRI
ncbi:hypothetical protein [Candidatus Magnetaquicoccus inordinatus]|nr:hypothetical protein [Candidatus Magnetaquicoccus inordinatus]